MNNQGDKGFTPLENQNVGLKVMGGVPTVICTKSLRRRGKKFLTGFTLMELLISLGIFAIVLGSSVFALFSAHQLSQSSRDRLLALNTARSVLETVKNTPLANIDNITQAQLNALVPQLANGTLLLRAIPPNPIVSMTWNGDITGLGGNLNNDNLATITVRIQWLGPGNKPAILEVTTMKSRY